MEIRQRRRFGAHYYYQSSYPSLDDARQQWSLSGGTDGGAIPGMFDHNDANSNAIRYDTIRNDLISL
jgi:hypothetical protein